MNEASASRNDSVGPYQMLDYNATLSASGKQGLAGDFERSVAGSQGLYIADNSAISTGDIDWTLSVWVQMESDPGAIMPIISKVDGTPNNEYYLWWDGATDKFNFWVWCNNGANVTSLTTTATYPGNGTWYLVVCWHDVTNNQIGIQVNNGTPELVSTGANFSQDTTAYIRVGFDYRLPPTVSGWDGLIDEIRFWKRLLTPAEKTTLYGTLGAGIPSPADRPYCQDMNACWKMDEASGTRADTYNSNTLSVAGSVGSGAGVSAGLNNAAQFFRTTSATVDTLTLADNADISAGNTDFTITAWVRFESPLPTSYMPILSKDQGAAATREYSLYWLNTGQVGWILMNSAGSPIANPLTAAGSVNSALTWYFVTVWHDSVNDLAGLTINDGLPILATTGGGAVHDSASLFRIGGDYLTAGGNVASRLGGRVDNVTFHRRVLSGTERRAVYNSGTGTACLDPGTPGSTAIVSATEQVSGAVAVDFNSTSSGCSAITGTVLYVRPPDGVWTNTGLASIPGTSGTFNYTPTAGSGTYYFQTVATNTQGTVEAAPAGSTGTGDDNLLWFSALNDPVTRIIATGPGSYDFPMEPGGCTITLNFSSVQTASTVTVQRVESVGVPCGGLNTAELAAERLEIVDNASLGTFNCDISWTFQNPNGLSAGQITRGYRCQTGNLTPFTASTTGSTTTIPGVSGFSSWYIGSVLGVKDWPKF